MSQDTKRFFIATAALIGTIIGVGIFGVPYAIGRSGVGVAIAYFIVLGAIQLLQHLFYAEAAIACPEKLRLKGLVERYLGRRAGIIAGVSTILGFWGALLAYVIVGGKFLYILFSPLLGGPEFFYQILWGAAGAVILHFGLEFVSKVDFTATVALLAAMVAIILLGIPHVRPEHLAAFTGSDLFLPYGVILFSLSGLPVIPEMEDMLKGKHAHFRSAVIFGTVIAAVLTALFGFVVLGVTGPAVTEDAVSGLRIILGRGITMLTAMFGFLAVATSYFATGLNQKSTFQYDLKFHKTSAWMLATWVPVIIFLAGAMSFVKIIGFTGAVFGGITSVYVAALYIAITKRKLVRKKPLGVPLFFAYASILILAIGVVWEIAATLRNSI